MAFISGFGLVNLKETDLFEVDWAGKQSSTWLPCLTEPTGENWVDETMTFWNFNSHGRDHHAASQYWNDSNLHNDLLRVMDSANGTYRMSRRLIGLFRFRLRNKVFPSRSWYYNPVLPNTPWIPFNLKGTQHPKYDVVSNERNIVTKNWEQPFSSENQASWMWSYRCKFLFGVFVPTFYEQVMNLSVCLSATVSRLQLKYFPKYTTPL